MPNTFSIAGISISSQPPVASGAIRIGDLVALGEVGVEIVLRAKRE